MKRKVLLLSLLMLANIVCMASCNVFGRRTPQKNIQQDSAVYAILGRTMSDILFNPSSVVCYSLKGVENVEQDMVQVEPHWVRDSVLGILSPQLYGVLQFALISNIENYKDDSIKVKSPYCPVIEFEFRQKKKNVHILISMSDFSWTIMYDDKRQIHYNYQDRQLINRLCEFFLTNTK
ncbi:MAG: hypothetical protein IJR13_00670 [Bacteroidales bacterium]|nr:hypothetical protein [Bacteroidales bacterium]